MSQARLLLASALLILGIAVAPGSVARASILPIIDHAILDGQVVLFLTNPLDQPLDVLGIVSELDGQGHRIGPSGSTIEPGEGIGIPLGLPLPARPGSYVITSRLRFTYGDRSNLDAVRNIIDVDIIDQDEKRRIPEACTAPNLQFSASTDLVLRSSDPAHLRIAFPDGITVRSSVVGDAEHTLRIESETHSGLRSGFYYGIVERDEDGEHSAGICHGFITTGLTTRNLYTRGRVPSSALAAIALLMLGIAITRGPAADRGEADARVMVRWASRVALLALGYLFWKDLDLVLEWGAATVAWAPLRSVLEAGVLHLRDPVFQPFFTYFVDPYFLGSLTLGWFLFRRSTDATPLDQDKYVSLVRSLDPRRSDRFNAAAKLGAQVCGVKIFFTPLMTALAISHLMGLPTLLRELQPELRVVLDAIMRTCFLIDTSIFAFGYVVESKRLGSEIRSVDPYLLGWFVCLACYAPFDTITFAPFAIGTANPIDAPAWVGDALAVLVVCFWIFYTSATVALGPKAANLVNRGIVERGPYRLVRHPAYAAKLSIWAIDCAFFGRAPVFQWFGFALFYVGRAWTEERHLRADPDYESYRQRVRYWFIPRVL